MKKLLLSLLFALVALTGLQAQTIWDGTADTEWYNETSTKFEISTAEQLAGLAELVNNGKNFSGKTISLTADIVLNNTSEWENWESSAPNNTWTPIGANWNSFFSGTFDGQGHTVSGIYNNSENFYQGLFGYNQGIIKNIGVRESYIKGDSYVGGVCGFNGGTISNCYNTGTVNGIGENSNVGGVCGYNEYGTISNCYNSGKVSGNSYVGGVCGHNYGTISNCYFLQGTADGGINGNDESGKAEVKTSEQFASGEVCWLLNGSSDANPTWFQTLNTDDYPVLDDAHTTVYAIGNCPNDINNSYSNQGPSNVGGHTDNDNDFRCDYCGMVMLQEPELSEGVYQISNLAELYWFAGLVNGSLSGVEQNREANAVLTADITINENVLDANGDLTESTDDLLVWTPIGANWNIIFGGTFDGQGHTVSGIYINSENDYQGLFGYNEGTIKNIGVTESYIKGEYSVGGVCGYNSYGTISNCHNSGTVSGDWHVGGVCGLNDGTIFNCYNSGNVSGKNMIGGVCGCNNDNTNSNCYNTGTVNGGDYVGGVCGLNYCSTISNCYNTGTVSGTNHVGGVCGENDNGTISNCYYLTNTAEGGINGSTENGQAEVKTAEQFASGEVCWLLNGNSDQNPVWFQTLDTDDYPVLNDAHATIYAIGNCPNSTTTYNNNESNVGDHTDNDNDGRCDFCGKIMISEPAQKEGVYQISNRAELYWFAGLVNGTLSGVEQNTAANAVLTADIIINENVLDAEGNLTDDTENLFNWTPIAHYDPFHGTFDGQGHIISGISVIANHDETVGLFGHNEGSIINLGIEDSYILYRYDKSISRVGGVCGDNSGTISNCYNSGTVNGNDSETGGICGRNFGGTISNCYNIGKVSGYYSVGSVCGYNFYGTISNCYYLEGTADGSIYGSDVSGQAEVKTAEQFASGEVCWLLNEEQPEGAWGQKLGTDPCPVLGGPAVFKDGETYYNEEGSAIIETNSEQTSFVIVSENLTIKIYGNGHEATVYNLAGNIVYQGIERIIPVPNPGMYMVRIGNEAQKTVVR